MIALKGKRSFSVSPALREHMIVEEELPAFDDTYLFHFEPKVRQHNREGIYIPGLTDTENLPTIQELAADDMWKRLERRCVHPYGNVRGHTDEPAGGASYWFPEEMRPQIFQGTRAFSKSVGALMNFHRTLVVPDRMKFPTGETVTVWRMVTNSLDVLVEVGLQGTDWPPIPDIDPKQQISAIPYLLKAG
jgi:hypothetical protein